jgi:hypothetical protein
MGLPKHSARHVYVLSLVDVGRVVTDCSDNVISQTLVSTSAGRRELGTFGRFPRWYALFWDDSAGFA